MCFFSSPLFIDHWLHLHHTKTVMFCPSLSSFIYLNHMLFYPSLQGIVKRRCSELHFGKKKMLLNSDHSCFSFLARSRSAFSSLESWFHQDGVWWAFNCWRTWKPSSCTTTNSECEKGAVNLGVVCICVWSGGSLVYYCSQLQYILFIQKNFITPTCDLRGNLSTDVY